MIYMSFYVFDFHTYPQKYPQIVFRLNFGDRTYQVALLTPWQWFAPVVLLRGHTLTMTLFCCERTGYPTPQFKLVSSI